MLKNRLSVFGFVGLWLKTQNITIIKQISHGRFFPYNAAIHSTLLLKPKTKLVLKVPDISQKLSVERELALKDIQ